MSVTYPDVRCQKQRHFERGWQAVGTTLRSAEQEILRLRVLETVRIEENTWQGHARTPFSSGTRSENVAQHVNKGLHAEADR